jgi:hypothetical protein
MENFRMNGDQVILKTNGKEYIFRKAEVVFSGEKYSNIFSKKNNKPLAETINNKKYEKLKSPIMEKYHKQLDCKIGVFLYKLKSENDLFYKEFLNQYGDKVYTEFQITDKQILNEKGLYLYFLDNQIKYIGKSNDSFGERINQGYGRIQPKNCFKDGQVTNCHINSLIADINKIDFFVLSLKNKENIDELEKLLIQEYNPDWNIQLRHKKPDCGNN